MEAFDDAAIFILSDWVLIPRSMCNVRTDQSIPIVGQISFSLYLFLEVKI